MSLRRSTYALFTFPSYRLTRTRNSTKRWKHRQNLRSHWGKMWLVEPLGFKINDYYLRRAGLDYWDELEWEVVASWDDLVTRVTAEGGRLGWFFSRMPQKPTQISPINMAMCLFLGVNQAVSHNRSKRNMPNNSSRFPLDLRYVA